MTFHFGNFWVSKKIISEVCQKELIRHYMKLRAFVYLVVFISILLPRELIALTNVREIVWYDSKIKQRKRIDLSTGILSIERSMGYWQKESELRIDSSLILHLPPRIAPHYIPMGNGRIRFALSGTGQVLEWDEIKNTLTRIDHTFYAGYNFGSAVFSRQNQLYSFGGSGFWNFSRALTYFSESAKEWENIKVKNLGPQAIFNGFQGYSQGEDRFFAGGSEFHAFLDEDSGQRDPGFYSFDFDQKSWSYLGDISSDLLAAMDQDIFWTGRYFVQFSSEGLNIIDPVENQVYAVNRSEADLQVAPLMFVSENKLIGYWDEEGGKSKVYDIQAYLKIAKPIGQFYTRPNYLLSGGLAFVALAILVFLFFSKRRTKLKSDLELDEFEMKLLRALLDSEQGLTSIEVNEILGLSTKSMDNQRKLRVQVIASINQKFHLKYRTGNIIVRNSSSVDKRQSQYALVPEARSICQKFI